MLPRPATIDGRRGIRRAVAASIVAALVAAGCGQRTADRPLAARPAASSSPAAAPLSEPSTPSGGSPAFRGTIAPIPPFLAARMRGTTWHVGCPVPIADLRLLTLSYWGTDGQVHEGPMVVNAVVARAVVSVFGQLFRARFPIVRIALSTTFDPNADPNTRTSITGSFSCRPVVTPAGAGTTLSMHSYGLAIDVNPLQNPFVAADGSTRNRYARPYLHRSQHLPGMIHDGDVVVRAFERIGWSWGGRWTHGKDYMHFSSNGR